MLKLRGSQFCNEILTNKSLTYLFPATCLFSLVERGSWSEFKNTLEVYSSNRDVFERLKATLLGLEKAKAVPKADWLLAPISEIYN